MLDWCRNQQHQDSPHNQLNLAAGISFQKQVQLRTIPPPKFTNGTSQIQCINLNTKKGIKIHLNRSIKFNKETQTNLEVSTKIGKDCYTQTEAIIIHSLNSRRNSVTTSKQGSPVKTKPLLTLRPQTKSELIYTLQVSKTIDQKNERNRQTKASFNMQQSHQDKTSKSFEGFYNKFKGVQSYHVASSKLGGETGIQLNKLNDRQLMKSRLPHKQYQISQKLLSSIRNTINEQQQQNTFSQKYKTMLRNVQSQFKLSGLKLSQKKLKYTPDKKILFHQRQTIISKYGQSVRDDQKSLRIQQSLVYDRQIKSAFKSIGKIQIYDTFVISLAMEKIIHMIVSIKEISVRFMKYISQQLLIYRELEERKIIVQGILHLYQTQIDRQTYMFIKQPYTQTLKQFIQKGGNFFEISIKIGNFLQQMEGYGFTLKQYPRIKDFVVSYSSIKLQNAGIFEFQTNKKIQIQQAIDNLRQQASQIHF